ncbi:hypothetical protein [Desulfosporosinus fructosivorans]
MNYTAEAVYRTGNQFFAASTAISEKLSQTNDLQLYLASFVTNMSLTIELYLKSLYILHREKKPPLSHDLKQMYNALNEENKSWIKNQYNHYLNIDEGIKVMKSKVPEMETELEVVLIQIYKAFVKWRYNHEGNLTSFPTSGPLSQALRARIKSLKPEWN